MRLQPLQLIWSRLQKKVQKEFLFLLGLFATTGLICWTAWIFDRPPQPDSQGVTEGIDTYIPQGMVLVPIEVQNLESLDSVFGQKGVADLYWVGRDGRSAQAAARGVALYRAPLNPRQFAVLVPETEAPGLVKAGGAFHVVLLNPQSVGHGKKLAEHKTERVSPLRVRVLGSFDEGDSASAEENDAQP